MLTTAPRSAGHAAGVPHVHYFVTAAKDGWHIRVTDLTTGQSGLIVRTATEAGAMMRRSLHGRIAPYTMPIAIDSSPFTSPGSAFCWPGQAGCYSYDAPAWEPEPAHPHHQRHLRRWLTPERLGRRQRLGGKAEITDPTETGSTCSAYGGPIYPYNADGSSTVGANGKATSLHRRSKQWCGPDHLLRDGHHSTGRAGRCTDASPRVVRGLVRDHRRTGNAARRSPSPAVRQLASSDGNASARRLHRTPRRRNLRRAHQVT